VVECDLAKVEVAGSNPVSRSRVQQIESRARRGLFLSVWVLGRQTFQAQTTPRLKSVLREHRNVTARDFGGAGRNRTESRVANT
jgi:uncharacterized protein YfaQ (DUF2300 family)